MDNNHIDHSLSMGEAFLALFVVQAQQAARLTQIQELTEAIYAEVKNKDLEEVRKHTSAANMQSYKRYMRSIFKDVGMSEENIEKILSQAKGEV